MTVRRTCRLRVSCLPEIRTNFQKFVELDQLVFVFVVVYIIVQSGIRRFSQNCDTSLQVMLSLIHRLEILFMPVILFNNWFAIGRCCALPAVCCNMVVYVF